MYRITCDNEIVYDGRISDLLIMEGKLSLELNKTGSFTFTLPATHPIIDKIHKLVSIIRVFDDNTLLFTGRVLSINIDMLGSKTYECEGELAFLLDSIQRPKEYHNLTPEIYLRDKLDQHNSQVEAKKSFKLGKVDIESMNYSARADNSYSNTLDTIMDKLISSNGGYLRIRYEGTIRFLDYVKQYGNYTKQVIRFGDNLLDLTQFIDASSIITALIPLGKAPEGSEEGAKLTIESVNNGKDYIYDESAVKNYGWIIGTNEWQDVEVPLNLKNKGIKYLKDAIYQSLTIKLTAIDLHMVDISVDRIGLGDIVRVISNPHDIDTNMVVKKREYDLISPENDKIELGDTRPSLTDQQMSTSKFHLAADTLIETADKVAYINNSVAQVEIKVNTQTEQIQTIESDTATLATNYETYKTETDLRLAETDLRLAEIEAKLEELKGGNI